MASLGSYALVTAHAADGNTYALGIADVGATQADVFAGAANIDNIAPGDSEQGTLTITNTGNLAEFVGLQHTLTGAIFGNNGNTGQSIDSNYISIDYASNGNNPIYKYDNHPLQIMYQIQIYQLSTGQILNGKSSSQNGTPLGAPFSRTWFSTSDSGTATPFQIPPNGYAVVTYTYRLPIEAHNDYKGSSGTMEVTLSTAEIPSS